MSYSSRNGIQFLILYFPQSFMSKEEIISEPEEEETLKAACPCFPQIQLLQSQMRAILEMFPDHAWEFTGDRHRIETADESEALDLFFTLIDIGCDESLSQKDKIVWVGTNGLRHIIRNKIPFKLLSKTAKKK